MAWLHFPHEYIYPTLPYSNLKQIKAGVPQGSILDPVLDLLYTYDIRILQRNKKGNIYNTF